MPAVLTSSAHNRSPTQGGQVVQHYAAHVDRKLAVDLLGAMLAGFGIFNLVEGTINHHLLGLHHVNETFVRDQWLWWDRGFLLWGVLMLVGGWRLLKSGTGRAAPEPRH